MRQKIAPTSDELRAWIDRGLSGDKIAGPDPAAAPMGTDAEAAGAPPSEEERRMTAHPLVRPAAVSQTGHGGAVVSWPTALTGAALFLLIGALLVLQRMS